jgi:cystathionine beta-lyase/cystathionine gamma-synthase
MTIIPVEGLDPAIDADALDAPASSFAGLAACSASSQKTAARRRRALIERVQVPIAAWSWGGVESLITQPAKTTHAGMSREARAKQGITDGLVRLSVGLEAMEDLVADLGQALNAIRCGPSASAVWG